MAKRLTVIASLLFVFFPSLAQGLTGSWSVELDLLPSVALSSSSLSLAGDWSGWTFSGTGYWLGVDGWVWQEFGAIGKLFDADVEWTFLFGPLAPAFLYSLGEIHFSYADTDFTLYSAMVGPNVPGYFFSGGPSGGMVIVAKRTIGVVTFTSVTGIGAKLADFTITYSGTETYTKTYPVDPFPGGFRFTYEELSLAGIPVCCGISVDTTLAFTKEKGFDYLTVTAHNLISLCCDIAIGASATFRTDSKELALLPSWKGVEGCFTLYGDLQVTKELLDGLEIYGFKLVCEFSDCNKLEVLTALNVAKVEDIVGDVFQGEEFEYVSLSFCGPACCGGNYSLDITAYFQETGPLFGLSRVAAAVSFPLAEGFVLDFGLVAPTSGDPGLSLGWTLSF